VSAGKQEIALHEKSGTCCTYGVYVTRKRDPAIPEFFSRSSRKQLVKPQTNATINLTGFQERLHFRKLNISTFHQRPLLPGWQIICSIGLSEQPENSITAV